MYTTLDNNEKGRFVPSLVLGIIGGICALSYVSMVIFTASALPTLKDAVGALFLLSFPAAAIWLGNLGKTAINKKTPFYVPLALAFVYIELGIFTTINSVQAIISASLPIEALYELAGICAFGVSLFSALSILFFVIENRRGCQLSVVLATVFFVLCVLPHAYIYATQLNGPAGDANSFIFYVKAACWFLSSTAGEVFGAWALFLYVGRYMKPEDGAVPVGEKQPRTDTAKQNDAGDLYSSDEAASASQPQKGKIILAAALVLVISCFLAYVGQDFVSDKMVDEDELRRNDWRVERSMYYTNDIPEVTLPLTAQSEREIHFKKKNVSVRFLGAGVDSEGTLCIIADVSNASGALVQLSASYEKVNGYPMDTDIRVLVKPLETLRAKIAIQSKYLETTRTDINNLSNALTSMDISYGDDFSLYDIGEYECSIEFDAPEKYVAETEEEKTKAESELCYTDEYFDIYYQGFLSYDEYTYLAFFVQCKSPYVYSIRAEEVVPSSKYAYFGASGFFNRENSTAYMCGAVDVSSGTPEAFECSFYYDLYLPQTDGEKHLITFSVDPSKIVGE